MLRWIAWRHVVLSIAAFVVVGCQVLGADPNLPHPYPSGCKDFDLSARRCTLIVEELARGNGFAASDASSIDLLGDPGCGENHQPCVRTTSFVVRVRYHLRSGEAREVSDFCSVGGQYSILCSDTPELQVILPIQNGYHDAPCDGPPVRTETPAELQAGQTIPPTCPTPFPSPDPSTEAEEQPLQLQTIDIPINRTGDYDIELGRGTLANGILEETAAEASAIPPSSFYVRGPMWLELISLAPGGRAFDYYFEHGRSEGTEPFSAHLKFQVMAFDPGAVMRVSGVVIR